MILILLNYLSNIDNYLYAEQCCALGYGYKINWKNYEPATISTFFSKKYSFPRAPS